MIIFLSLKSFTVFDLKAFPLEVGGGEDQIGKSTYVMGDSSKRTCVTMGEGVKFLPHWYVRTNLMTPKLFDNFIIAFSLN